MRRDIVRVLEGAGVGLLQADVLRILSEGAVTETTMAPGTVMEWMALRRQGRAGIMRNVRWDGRQAEPAYEFVIDNLSETFTFLVPKVCGNIALVRREPSREAARRADEARMAADAERRRAEEARIAAAEDTRRVEEARKAEEMRKAEEALKAEEMRKAEEARRAEEARQAEEARKAEEARQAEAARAEAEARDLRRRPFVMGLVGKQQRQYDDTDPAGLGFPTSATVRDVPAFGDALVGIKGGVEFTLTDRWTFAPGIGVATNVETSDRTLLFSDAEFDFMFRNRAYVGSGLTFWNMTRREIFTLGWLGTAGVPVWRSDATKHELVFSVAWRQLFDRGSDPDVNYQFWGGIKYLFK